MTVAAPAGRERGAIAWMVRNRVAPNLLMLVLLLGGLFMANNIKKEVFPDFDLNAVNITVAYPGASPEEVEQGIVLAVEDAVSGIEGIDEVRSTADEGSARVTVELLDNADEQKAYQEIQQEIDRITTFPEDAERPQVNLATHRRLVQAVVIYGEVEERVLRELAEQLRDRLLQNPGITQVELVGVRNYEIHVEVSRETLRRYGLTLTQIADTIDNATVELPGGSVKTSAGEILLRVKQRSDWARQFARIPVITTRAGAVLRLGDIASVKEGFDDSDRERSFNGQPAASLEVYRVGEQTPVGVAQAVRETLAELQPELPAGHPHGGQHRPVEDLSAAPRAAADQRLHGPGAGPAAAGAVPGIQTGVLGHHGHSDSVSWRLSVFARPGCVHQHGFHVRFHYCARHCRRRRHHCRREHLRIPPARHEFYRRRHTGRPRRRAARQFQYPHQYRGLHAAVFRARYGGQAVCDLSHRGGQCLHAVLDRGLVCVAIPRGAYPRRRRDRTRALVARAPAGVQSLGAAFHPRPLWSGADFRAA